MFESLLKDEGALWKELSPIFVAVASVLIVACGWIWHRVRARNAAPTTPTVQPESVQRTRSQRNLAHDEVGVRFNKWRKPVSYFGPGEGEMKDQLCRKLGLPDLDIGAEEWDKATEVTDKVLKMLCAEIAKCASWYKIKIEKFVRQGSSREGLKVCAADEFDVLLQFSIEGLEIEVQPELDESGRTLPEFGKLQVLSPVHQLDIHYPRLFSAKSFFEQHGRVYLNSKMLHGKVFTAIIDRAGDSVTELVNTSSRYSFRISRAINPPAVKIGIDFYTDKAEDDFDARSSVGRAYNRYLDNNQLQNLTIGTEARIVPVKIKRSTDVDIVPALLIRHDQVPDPAEYGAMMDCPRYAVLKWVKDDHPFVLSQGIFPGTIWRMDSSGYEKHVIDVAQGTPEQQYILTAQRVLKAFFIYENRKRILKNESPSQLVTVLRSYFLKQVAFYCILYYTVLHKYPLSGVKEALTILLDFLQISLEEKRLPHFFHNNPWLGCMFPDYDFGNYGLRYDLFHTIKRDCLLQADRSLRWHVRPRLREFTGPLNPVVLDIQKKFREFIATGEY